MNTPARSNRTTVAASNPVPVVKLWRARCAVAAVPSGCPLLVRELMLCNPTKKPYSHSALDVRLIRSPSLIISNMFTVRSHSAGRAPFCYKSVRWTSVTANLEACGADAMSGARAVVQSQGTDRQGSSLKGYFAARVFPGNSPGGGNFRLGPARRNPPAVKDNIGQHRVTAAP